MQDKQPITSHRGYEQADYGKRRAANKAMQPNFTGTGLRVDHLGCGLDDGGDYTGKSEYFNDLSGRVSR